MRLVVLFVTLLLIAVILKVFYIQVFQYQKLNSLANDLWQRNLPITPDRGLILDRNGKVLASNITTTSLYLVPNQIKNKEDVAKTLSEILNIINMLVKKLRLKESTPKVASYPLK